MEFPFDCTKVMKADKDGFACLDPEKFVVLSKDKFISQVIDTFGILSAKSQGLQNIITTMDKLVSSDNRIYIKTDGKKAIGFIKVGKKNLFIRNEIGKIFEISPLCVLDFYVHESVQRSGYGRVFIDNN